MTPRLILVPVRHHSPACARLVRALLRLHRPAAVAVELPADLQPVAPLLGDARLQPPAALFALGDAASGGRSAFYPLAAFSPEWVALQEAAAAGVTATFIDLAQTRRAAMAEQPAVDPVPGLLPVWDERPLATASGMAAFTAATGRSDFNAAWDAAVEAQPFAAADPQPLLDRLHRLAELLRDAPPMGGEVLTVAREDAMAEALRLLLARHGDGPVLAVVGALHAPAILARLATAGWQPSEPPPAAGSVTGYLVPWDHARLEAASGYRAGLVQTGWYLRSWQASDSERDADSLHGEARRFLLQVSRAARAAKLSQPPALPEVVEAALAARRLAALRGGIAPTRSDTVEAAALSFVRGARDPDGTAILALIDTLLQGEGRGAVPEGLGRPPLVDDMRRRAAALGLDLTYPDAQRLRLDALKTAQEQPLARFLAQLDLLDIGFAHRMAGPDLLTATDLTRRSEDWIWRWTPEVEARLIERAMLGADVPSAAAGQVLVSMAAVEPWAALDRLSALLVRAVLADLSALVEPLTAALAQAVATETRLQPLAAVLVRLEALLATAEALGLGADAAACVGALLAPVFTAACLALPDAVPHDDLQPSPGDSLRLLRRLASAPAELAAWGVAPLPRTLLVQAAELALARQPPAPLWLQGACRALHFAITGGDAVALGAALAGPLAGTLPPDEGCAALEGALAVDRTLVWQFPQIAAAVSRGVASLQEDAFLAALPHLRLAFSALTPAEIARLVETLDPQPHGVTAPLPDAAPLEAPLQALLRRDGLHAPEAPT